MMVMALTKASRKPTFGIEAPQAAPEALASVDKANTELVVRFPVDGSVIEGRKTEVPLPFILKNVEYPVFAITNNIKGNWLTLDQSNLFLSQAGSYVTARQAPANERVVTTLEDWGVGANEVFFLGGMSKDRILSVLKPHMFFDDQKAHLATAGGTIPMVHIPFGIANVSQKLIIKS